MKRLLLSTILLIAIFTCGKSQSKIDFQTYPNLGIMQYIVLQDTDSLPQSNYTNSSFQNGKLITKSNIALDSIQIRYNIRKDEMECKIGSQHSKISSPAKLKEVNINGECFEYLNYLVKKDTTSGYLHKIKDGKTSIFAKYFLYETKNFTAVEDSYLLANINGKLPVKFSSAKKLISYVYGDLAKEALEYSKSNGLIIDKPCDLKKLIAYLSILEKDNVSSL